MTIAEMKASIAKIEKMKKRGLLSVEEAEDRINQFIDEALPSESVLDEESWRRMEQRRLAKRRMWRFLLSESKTANEIL